MPLTSGMAFFLTAFTDLTSERRYQGAPISGEAIDAWTDRNCPNREQADAVRIVVRVADIHLSNWQTERQRKRDLLESKRAGKRSRRRGKR